MYERNQRLVFGILQISTYKVIITTALQINFLSFLLDILKGSTFRRMTSSVLRYNRTKGPTCSQLGPLDEANYYQVQRQSSKPNGKTVSSIDRKAATPSTTSLADQIHHRRNTITDRIILQGNQVNTESQITAGSDVN